MKKEVWKPAALNKIFLKDKKVIRKAALVKFDQYGKQMESH